MSKAIVLSRVSSVGQDLSQQTDEVLREAHKDGYTNRNIIIIEDVESAIKLSEEERKERRKAQQRARYWRDRERILAQQRIYREEHKEHLKQLRRERDFKRIYMNPKREKFTKSKAERQHEYYMRAEGFCPAFS